MDGRFFSPGDTVRLCYRSYYDLAKSDYTQIYCFGDADGDPGKPMLGGIYRVASVEKNAWGVDVYRLAEADGRGKIVAEETAGHLYGIDEAPDCPYAVGNRVIFRPEDMPEVDLKLPIMESLAQSESPVFIEEIIAGFFVFVRTGDKNKMQFPLRWMDFTSA